MDRFCFYSQISLGYNTQWRVPFTIGLLKLLLYNMHYMLTISYANMGQYMLDYILITNPELQWLNTIKGNLPFTLHFHQACPQDSSGAQSTRTPGQWRYHHLELPVTWGFLHYHRKKRETKKNRRKQRLTPSSQFFQCLIVKLTSLCSHFTGYNWSHRPVHCGTGKYKEASLCFGEY